MYFFVTADLIMQILRQCPIIQKMKKIKQKAQREEEIVISSLLSLTFNVHRFALRIQYTCITYMSSMPIKCFNSVITISISKFLKVN